MDHRAFVTASQPQHTTNEHGPLKFAFPTISNLPERRHNSHHILHKAAIAVSRAFPRPSPGQSVRPMGFREDNKYRSLLLGAGLALGPMDMATTKA